MDQITRFMSEDHDRLDAIFAALTQKNCDNPKGLFARFDSGLRTHISWEEDLLFPVFEEKSGMRDSGPTAVMRMEHQQIKQVLDRIGADIGHARLDQNAQALLSVLGPHNDKEEEILYPMIDRLLMEPEKTTILKQMKGE